MDKPFIEIDAEHFSLSAFETKPIEGYEAPTNKETGEQFPNCCPFHKNVFEEAERWFNKFPNCCDQHKAMVSKWWYNKANYSGIAEKIVKQLSYTEHHISEQINVDDWYKDITDYIEYNISSFGHPAIGLHLYLGNVQHYIKNTKPETPKNKRQRLIEFIETYYNNPKETNKTDLNILYSTYQKWLKEFPFELNSYFGNLKQHFEKQLPILNGKPETNIYSGVAKAKMHTKCSLIEALINLTKELLSKINIREMVEKGIISDLNKHRFELESESLRIATSQITKDFSKGELQYIKALKKWLKLHKEYFKEITPLLKALPPQQTEINWIELYEIIDIEESVKPKVYITNTLEQNKNYFSEASFNLTIQYLTRFKKETYLLTPKRKLEYINSLNIEKPKVANSESPLFNQTVFEAQSNYCEFLTIYRGTLERTTPDPAETKMEQELQSENDFTLSTIEDWLFEFKKQMTEADYQSLVSALKQYFDTGAFPSLTKPIQINGRPNKKLFGWALNRIFEAKGKGIEKELLLFAKQNISLFSDVQFDETNILKSNLYKYFTTKTK